MTDVEDVRIRVEHCIEGLVLENGCPLAIGMGDKVVELEDEAVNEIMSSMCPEESKLAPSAYVREILVHSGYGTFVQGPEGPSGPLRVRLRRK